MRFYNKAIFFPIAMSLQTDLPPVIKKVIKNSLIIHTKKIYMNFFTGDNLENVWYTTIVAFGREYAFSLAGIECCQPVSL